MYIHIHTVYKYVYIVLIDIAFIYSINTIITRRLNTRLKRKKRLKRNNVLILVAFIHP